MKVCSCYWLFFSTLEKKKNPNFHNIETLKRNVAMTKSASEIAEKFIMNRVYRNI